MRQSTVNRFNAVFAEIAAKCASTDVQEANIAREQYIQMLAISELIEAVKPDIVDDVENIDLNSDDVRQFGLPSSRFDVKNIGKDIRPNLGAKVDASRPEYSTTQLNNMLKSEVVDIVGALGVNTDGMTKDALINAYMNYYA